MTALDLRLNAFRSDLADMRLKGQVEAERYVDGVAAVVTVPVADVKSAPRGDAGVDHQLLLGDRVLVFDRAGGWAWVQAARDDYVGYVSETGLGDPGPVATHLVAVPRSFAYPTDDLKSAPALPLSMGCAVTVTGHTERRGTSYAALSTGQSVIAGHLRAVEEPADDFVSVCESLERTPYLWGGTSGCGVDCSGIIHLAMRMTGKSVLRDTDMQERTIGTEIDGASLRRGDLVFWKGHVAIMTDAATAIHANGHSMLVTRESIADAIVRLHPFYGAPSSFRRP